MIMAGQSRTRTADQSKVRIGRIRTGNRIFVHTNTGIEAAADEIDGLPSS